MESKQITILAIDDNSDNLTTIKALVMEAFPHAALLTATSGEDGIALARAQDPDVVLLDIVMPGMDGFTVCLVLKAEETLRNIPVVFVTALKADKTSRIRALECGGEGFLSKPIDESELAAQITAMVKIKEGHTLKQNENQRLEAQVAQRTRELKRELEERNKTEEKLRESEDRYRRITEWITDYIYSVRIENNKSMESRHSIACEKVTGYTAEEFKNDPYLWISMVPREEQKSITNQVEKILAGENTSPMEHRIRRKDGQIRWVIDTAILKKDHHGNLVSYDGVVKDITEKKLAEEKLKASEERLRQSEKMEAIGALAGGIAHDFNNVLGGIIGYTDMSLEFVEKGSMLEKYLRKILKASDRAKDLVKQILTFSRVDNQQKSIVAVGAIVKEVLGLLKASIPSSVTIQSDVCNETKPILADPTKIHEMLLNLATNAVYAMERKGVLTVRLFTEILEEEAVGRIGVIAPGEYAVIEVADTGTGMDALTLKRAFEPFFTTKPVGQGTGMGLSVVLGVIQLHHGDLQIETQPGKGTLFRIFLPVTKGSESGEVVEDMLGCRGGNERILFIDDEQELVEIAMEMLGNLGYRVIGMTDSLEALKFMKEKGADIDILITDQTMPGMTGLEIAKAAGEMRKDLPVILCTGYGSEVSPQHTTAAGISRLISKPYRARELSESIRNLLDNIYRTKKD